MRSRRFLVDVAQAVALGALVGQVITSVVTNGIPLWRLGAVVAALVFTAWAYRRYRRRTAKERRDAA